MTPFPVIAFLTQSLDRQILTPWQDSTFGTFKIDIIQLTPSNVRISSGFVANSLPFCEGYRFAQWQICFTSSFEFAVSSNISNGLAFYGMSNNTFASSVHFFDLTNADVRFRFNSGTFFYFTSRFLVGGSAISKTSPLTWTVACGNRS